MVRKQILIKYYPCIPVGIAHCPDKSDEGLFSLLTPSSSTSRSWYGKPMLISFCFLLILFIIFLICCLRHYYVFSSTKSYVTMSKIQKWKDSFFIIKQEQKINNKMHVINYGICFSSSFLLNKSWKKSN